MVLAQNGKKKIKNIFTYLNFGFYYFIIKLNILLKIQTYIFKKNSLTCVKLFFILKGKNWISPNENKILQKNF